MHAVMRATTKLRCSVSAGPRPGSSAGGGTLSNGAGSDPYGVMAAAMGKGPDTFQMQVRMHVGCVCNLQMRLIGTR